MCCFAAPSPAADIDGEAVKKVVDASITPLMEKYRIPGMSVGVTTHGQKFVFNYGLESKETKKEVSNRSLFEIGSISKTMTASLASLAQMDGKISFSDKVDQYLPDLKGTSFGNLTLLNLGTHTSGGLPLQLPAGVTTQTKLIEYLKEWKPNHKLGTVRNYANPGIGMLGYITAKCMHQDYDLLMKNFLFEPLGMKDSFIKIPSARLSDYAQGYTEKDSPIRMKRAVLSSEAYGVTTTATDLINFVEYNMGIKQGKEKLQHALLNTHLGYYKCGAMTQDLIWEQFALPVAEKDLLAASSPAIVLESAPVVEITPPMKPQTQAWIHKTGSTAGFAAYAAFIPEEKLGIVILANKSYPVDSRILAARKIFRGLGGHF
jgi:beta-lactamase class C